MSRGNDFFGFKKTLSSLNNTLTRLTVSLYYTITVLLSCRKETNRFPACLCLYSPQVVNPFFANGFKSMGYPTLFNHNVPQAYIESLKHI